MDSAAGICHFPSEEAFGLVVAEALARNLKFFGSRVGGILDISSSVLGAELFEPADFHGLTNGIERWLKAGASRLDGNDAVMCERYHPQVVARRHLDIYHELLDGESSSL